MRSGHSAVIYALRRLAGRLASMQELPTGAGVVRRGQYRQRPRHNTTFFTECDVMSEHGFHDHGSHDHEVEHQAHQGVGLAQYVAIFTAILSACGAVISYQGSATQVEAMLLKNDAVLKKAEATDQWPPYHANTNTGHLLEPAAQTAAPHAEQYRAKPAKYERENTDTK